MQYLILAKSRRWFYTVLMVIMKNFLKCVENVKNQNHHTKAKVMINLSWQGNLKTIENLGLNFNRKAY